jgi:hypothetical protein
MRTCRERNQLVGGIVLSFAAESDGRGLESRMPDQTLEVLGPEMS